MNTLAWSFVSVIIPPYFDFFHRSYSGDDAFYLGVVELVDFVVEHCFLHEELHLFDPVAKAYFAGFVHGVSRELFVFDQEFNR